MQKCFDEGGHQKASSKSTPCFAFNANRNAVLRGGAPAETRAESIEIERIWARDRLGAVVPSQGRARWLAAARRTARGPWFVREGARRHEDRDRCDFGFHETMTVLAKLCRLGVSHWVAA